MYRLRIQVLIGIGRIHTGLCYRPVFFSRINKFFYVDNSSFETKKNPYILNININLTARQIFANAIESFFKFPFVF